jgi:hypothetical protein
MDWIMTAWAEISQNYTDLQNKIFWRIFWR